MMIWQRGRALMKAAVAAFDLIPPDVRGHARTAMNVVVDFVVGGARC